MNNTVLKNEETSQFNYSSAIDVIKKRAQNALQQEIVPLNSKTIIANNELSCEDIQELVEVFANDNEPIIPEDPDELALFIEKNKSKSSTLDSALSPHIYKQKEATCKENAEDWLNAQLVLSQYLHSFPTKQGYQKNKIAELEEKGVMFRDVVAQKYGLTPTQLRCILELDQDCVDEAIKEAKETDDVVSRSKALAIKKQRIRRENKGDFDTKPDYSNEEPDEENLKNILQNKINYTVLFANIGIGESFLEEMGLEAKVAFELETDRCEFYSHRYPNVDVVNGDIFDKEKFNQAVELHEKHNCSLIMASPVCRPFSKMGSNNLDKIEAKLFYPTVEFIKATEPQYVMIENVPGFLTSVIPNMRDVIKDEKIIEMLSKYKTIGEYISQTLKSLGYDINIAKDQNAADYGTPQSRTRCIILASKTGVWQFPKKDTFRKSLVEAIGNLPSIEIGESSNLKHHTMINNVYHEEVINALKSIGSNQSKTISYTNEKGETRKITVSRKNAGLVCGTITGDSSGLGAHTANGHYGRPKSDGTYTDARPLTIREILIIIGLDPDMDIPQKFIDNDNNLRNILGEAFAPHHVKRLCQMIPFSKA